MRENMPSKGVGWNFAMWLSGIVGGIATFLGVFIAFGDSGEYVGLGGDLSWRVGDISDVWMYGLLIGGLVLLGTAVWMAIAGRNRIAIGSSARSDLILHTVVFVAVNAFVWAQDFAIGGGLDYALWMTVPWAVGLAIHAGRYFTRPSEEATLPTKELQHH